MISFIACNCVAFESFFTCNDGGQTNVYSFCDGRIARWKRNKLKDGEREKLVIEKRGTRLFYTHCTRILIGRHWIVYRDDEDGLQTFQRNFKPHCARHYATRNHRWK